MWYFAGRLSTSLQEHQVEFRMGCTMRNLWRQDGGCHRAASTNMKRWDSLFHPAALSTLAHRDISGYRCVIIVYESLGWLSLRCRLVRHLNRWQQMSEIHERSGCVGVHFEPGPANVIASDWGSGYALRGTREGQNESRSYTPEESRTHDHEIMVQYEFERLK
ncbi:hypothetical protein BDM02DRAFT_1757135 [Thelephora ganbajun]|uniref:Uncharacterized protein n=1 Tax=Thelephora ganbajun TaxID=370292 RepID=A0ACB6ZJR9_THEGA|nr:hypothetical protein BDM02DRAFT_1757135 [Thelephora ganbajun]